MAKSRQSFMEGALVLTLAVAIAKIVGALYRIPLTATIGEDGMGFYSTAYNFYLTIYSIAVSGFPTAIARIVAGYAAEGRYKDIRRTVSVSRALLVTLGVLCTVLLVVAARPYVNWIKSPKAYYCILAVAPSIIFSCLMSVHRGYNQGMSNMSPTAVSQVIEVMFKAAAGLGGAYLFKSHFTNEYLASATVFGTSMSGESEAQVTILSLAAAGAIFGVSLSTLAGYLYLLFRRIIRGDGITAEQLQDSPRAHSEHYIMKQLMTIGVPIAVSAVTVTLTGLIDNASILTRLDLVVRTGLAELYASHHGVLELAEKELADIPNYLYGVYNLGIPLFNLVPAFTGSFGMSALPHITEAWTVQNKKRLKRRMESALRVTMLVAAPAGMGISALAGPIAKLIYPTRPVGAELLGPILALLGVAAIFVAIVGPVNSMLQAIGRVNVPVKLMLLGGAVKLATNYFLVAVPSLNIKAAPLGNLLCYLTITILSLAALSKTTGVKLDVSGVILKPLLAGALTGAVARLGYMLLTGYLGEKLATLAGVGAGVIAYLASVSLMRLLEPLDVLELPGGKKLSAILEKLHILR